MLKILAAAMLSGLLPVSTFAQGPAAGCPKQGTVYTCNWEAFHAEIDHARTLTVHTESLDPYTGVQLKDMAKTLGKTVVEKDADIGFEIRPVDSTGVVIGPGDEAIAELRAYARAPLTNRWELVWVETYTGQLDRPWASAVNSVIEQFEARLKKQLRLLRRIQRSSMQSP